MQNNEVFNVFEIDKDNKEYLNIINSAIMYFDNLAKDFNSFDKNIFVKIKNYEYYNEQEDNSIVRFISNYDEAIMSQIKRMISKVDSIDIAVPFYDNGLDALEKIKNLYPNTKINLFIQNTLSTFNFKLNEKQRIIPEDSLFIFDGFKKIGTKKNYHGKVFRFNVGAFSYILYGSANCTNAALFEDSKVGNYECDVLVKGNLNDFDYFFNNFVRIDKNALISNRVIENYNKTKYNFMFILSGNNQELIFKYKNRYDDLKIFINDAKVEFNYIDDKIVILTKDLSITGLFKVVFNYNNIFETLTCYQLNNNLIEFRNSIKSNINIPRDKIIDNKEDSFCKYYTMLLNLVPYTSEDLEEYQKDSRLYDDVKTENECNNEDEDSFIVDFDVPEEILNKQRQYTYVEDLKQNVITRFVSRLKSGIISETHGRHNGSGKENDEQEPRKYKPRSGESGFVSTITRLFNNILDSKYLTNDENFESVLKQYIDNILLLLNVIFTYNEDHDSNIFNIEKYNSNILRFIESLMNINLDSISDDIIEAIKVLLFVPIIYHCISKEELEEVVIGNRDLVANRNWEKERNIIDKMEVNIKRVLLCYDKKFSLKNDYYKYLDKACSILPVDTDCDIINNYVAKILDYYDEEEIDLFIKSKFGDNTRISKDNAICKIEFYTDDIKRYMNVTNIEYVLKKIKNSYKQIGKINSLDLYIYNNNMELNAVNPLEFINYKYDFKSSMIEKWYKNINDKDKRNIINEVLY